MFLDSYRIKINVKSYYFKVYTSDIETDIYLVHGDETCVSGSLNIYQGAALGRVAAADFIREFCRAFGSAEFLVDTMAITAESAVGEPTFTPDELDAIKRMFCEHFSRSRRLSKIEQSIIAKCDDALGGRER